MFIINKAGVFHSIPDDWPIPAGSRKASKEEVEGWLAADKAGKEAKLERIAKERKQQAEMLGLPTVPTPASPPHAPAPVIQMRPKDK